jgi:ATP-binding cassette subfamily B multidrug efflux pump
MTAASAKTSTLRRLLRMSSSDRRQWRTAILLLLLATVADVIGPLLVGRYVSEIVSGADARLADAWPLALAFLASLLCLAVCQYRQAMILQAIAQGVIADLRRRAYASVLRREMSYFDSAPLGALVSRLANDTESVKELFVQVVGTYIQSAFRVTGIFVGMAILDMRLMWICLLFLPVAIAMMVAYRRLSTPVFQAARRLLSDINARLSESLQGVRLIQLFGQEAVFQRRFDEVVDQHVRVRHRNLRLDALMLRPFLDFVQALLLIGIVWHFAERSFVEAVDTGVIYAFLHYVGRFTEPVVEVTQKLGLMQQAMVAGERVFAMIDGAAGSRQGDAGVSGPSETGASRQEGTGVLASVPARADIAFHSVSFAYPGTDTRALSDLTLTLSQGQFIGIVGHTGSGKSTLVSLLLRFHQPTQGVVTWGGVALEALEPTAFRASIGWVPQDAFMFAGTVRDNILIDRVMPETVLLERLQRAGLQDAVAGLPEGLDTVLSERGANISSGQRQWIALARALVRDPVVLVLDEATASLDSDSEQHVQRALARLRGSITVVAIAHRLSTIADADRIVVLRKGQLVESGTHTELLERQGIYQAMYCMQGRLPSIR